MDVRSRRDFFGHLGLLPDLYTFNEEHQTAVKLTDNLGPEAGVIEVVPFGEMQSVGRRGPWCGHSSQWSDPRGGIIIGSGKIVLITQTKY